MTTLVLYVIVGIAVTAFYGAYRQRMRPRDVILSICIWPAYLAGFAYGMAINIFVRDSAKRKELAQRFRRISSGLFTLFLCVLFASVIVELWALLTEGHI